MDSRKCFLKSLRNSLLGSAVIHFPEIFIDFKKRLRCIRSLYDVKCHICLPPRLFEDLMQKSREMCWSISPNYLKSCLAYIDALNWRNINISTYEVTDDDLKVISESGFPIKVLTIRKTTFTEESIRYLGKLASSLEILEVLPIKSNDEFYDCSVPSRYSQLLSKKDSGESTKTEPRLSLPKLKKLNTSCDKVPKNCIARIDFWSCRDTLEVLRLDKLSVFSKDSISLIASVRCLKALRFLSLDNLFIESPHFQHNDYRFQSNKVEILLHVLISLKSLRYLSMKYSHCRSLKLTTFMNFLRKWPNLTNVDVSYAFFYEYQCPMLRDTRLEAVLDSLNNNNNNSDQYETKHEYDDMRGCNYPVSERRGCEMNYMEIIEWFYIEYSTNYAAIGCYLDCRQWEETFLRNLANLLLSKSSHQRMIFTKYPFKSMMKSVNLVRQMLKDFLSSPTSSRSKFILDYICRHHRFDEFSRDTYPLHLTLHEAGILQVVEDITNKISSARNLTTALEFRKTALCIQKDAEDLQNMSEDALNCESGRKIRFDIVSRCLGILTSFSRSMDFINKQ